MQLTQQTSYLFTQLQIVYFLNARHFPIPAQQVSNQHQVYGYKECHSEEDELLVQILEQVEEDEKGEEGEESGEDETQLGDPVERLLKHNKDQVNTPLPR